ncbi:YdaE family protein [Escherichia coli]
MVMTKKIKCAYHPTTEMKKYCSESCAEKDQMAHEL